MKVFIVTDQEGVSGCVCGGYGKGSVALLGLMSLVSGLLVSPSSEFAFKAIAPFIAAAGK